MSTLSWHHSLCELMTLEKSSIGSRLEAATPLTRWKHAFSPCCNGRDFTRACVCLLTSKRTKCRAVSIANKRCEGKRALPTLCWVPSTSLERSGKMTRLRRFVCNRVFLRLFELISNKMPRSSYCLRYGKNRFGKRRWSLNPCLFICIVPCI